MIYGGRGRYIEQYAEHSFDNTSQSRDVESIIYSKLLESPYDTHCNIYNVSRRYCYNTCQYHHKEVETCNNLCFRRDCETLKAVYYNEYRNSGQLHTSEFMSEGTLIVLSRPSETFMDLSLIVLGVIGIFIGLNPYVIICYLIDITIHKYQIYNPNSHASENLALFKRLGLIVSAIIAKIFISINVAGYLSRQSATDAYLGPVDYNFNMSIRICYEHKSMVENIPYKHLEEVTKKFDELFEIRTRGFHYDGIGFVNNTKCFFGRLNISEVDSKIYLVKIESKSYEPFYFSSSIDGSYPIGDHQMKVTKDQTVITHMFKYSSHPSFTKCNSYRKYKGSRDHCYKYCILSSYYKAFRKLNLRIMVFNGSENFLTHDKIPEALLTKCDSKCCEPACSSSMLFLQNTNFRESKFPKLTVARGGIAEVIREHDSQTLSEQLLFDGILLSAFTGSSIRSSLLMIRSIPNSMANILSAFGSLIHLTPIVQRYFAYEIQTKVFSGFADTSNFPCATYFVYKNIRNIKLKNEPLIYKCASNLFDNFSTIPNIFAELVIAKSSRYDYEKIKGQELNENTIQYMNTQYRATTLNLRRITKSWPAFTTSPENVILKLRLSSMFRNCIMMDDDSFPSSISFHECNTWPEIETSVRFLPAIHDIGYDVNVVQRLSQPYGELCQPHRKSDKIDWLSCLNTNNNKIDSNENIHQTSMPGLIASFDIETKVMECVNNLSLIPSCETATYPITKFVKQNPNFDQGISIIGPIRETKTEYFPLLPLSLLLLSLLDSIGLWFGLDAYTVLVYLFVSCSALSFVYALFLNLSQARRIWRRIKGVLPHNSIYPEPRVMFIRRKMDENQNSAVEEDVSWEDIE